MGALLLMNKHISSSQVALHPLAMVVVGKVTATDDPHTGQQIKLSICNGCNSSNTRVACGTELDFPGIDGVATEDTEVSMVLLQNNTLGRFVVDNTTGLSLVSNGRQERVVPLVQVFKGTADEPERRKPPDNDSLSHSAFAVGFQHPCLLLEADMSYLLF